MKVIKDITDNYHQKYIFIDLDGTLTNSNREISKKNIEQIKRLQNLNNEIIICSGRNREYTVEKSKICNISKYVISSNGAEIFDIASNQIIYENIIKNSTVIKIFNYCIRNNIVCKLNSGNTRIISNLIEEPIEKILKNYKINQIAIETGYILDILKLRNYVENNFDDVSILNYSKNVYDPSDKSDRAWLDIANKDVSKGNSIKILLNILNVNKENAIAIGDSDNDISMFENVGYGVAMKNASENLKKIANEITLSNNDDGVAEFLKKIK